MRERSSAPILAAMRAGNEFTTNLEDANVVRRLRVGIASLALGLALAVFFAKVNASQNVRLSLFVPFFVSANFFFQTIYQTCGYSAWRGVRHTCQGQERIADRRERALIRARGLKQVVVATVVACGLTGLFMTLG